MKTLIRFCFWFLVIVPTVLFGQRFLVILNSTSPDLPIGWPTHTSNPLPLEYTAIPLGWTTNWTKEQLDGRKLALKTEYDWIQASNHAVLLEQLAVVESERNASIQALQDLFNDFDVYETGWRAGTNYNNATLQVILRKHNGALLLLKPMLKELYDSRQ